MQKPAKASVVRQPKKVYCEMNGMGAKSITIVRAVTTDFFFDCRAAEVLMFYLPASYTYISLGFMSPFTFGKQNVPNIAYFSNGLRSKIFKFLNNAVLFFAQNITWRTC
jgi:hypothetical protein